MAERTTTQQPFAGWDKPDLDLSNAQWRSGSQGAGDVQIAFVEGFIAMRNAGKPAARRSSSRRPNGAPSW